MGEWKKVKLGDCIKEVVEKTTENNQHQVLSVTKDGIFSQEEFFKKQIASENNIGYKVIRRNNLVFSTMNLWMGSLDVLTNYDIGIVSPAYKIFKFNEELMLPSYGNYFMKSYYMLETYRNCSEQGASIVRRNLDLKSLLNTNINIPLIAEQEKIVKILEKVDLIIKKYEKLLEEKNRFIKSQFVEMFDPALPLKEGCKIATFKDVCELVNGKAFKPSEWSKNGIPIVRIQNLKDINAEYNYYNGPVEEKYRLENSDLVFAWSGTPGSSFGAYIWKGQEAVLNQHIFNVHPKENINKTFLECTFNGRLKEIISKSHGGAGLKHITKPELEKISLVLPTMEIQKAFISIVELIDKQKFELERIIENYKKLKKGLMQQLLTGKIKVKI